MCQALIREQYFVCLCSSELVGEDSLRLPTPGAAAAHLNSVQFVLRVFAVDQHMVFSKDYTWLQSFGQSPVMAAMSQLMHRMRNDDNAVKKMKEMVSSVQGDGCGTTFIAVDNKMVDLGEAGKLFQRLLAEAVQSLVELVKDTVAGEAADASFEDDIGILTSLLKSLLDGVPSQVLHTSPTSV